MINTCLRYIKTCITDYGIDVKQIFMYIQYVFETLFNAPCIKHILRCVKGMLKHACVYVFVYVVCICSVFTFCGFHVLSDCLVLLACVS